MRVSGLSAILVVAAICFASECRGGYTLIGDGNCRDSAGNGFTKFGASGSTRESYTLEHSERICTDRGAIGFEVSEHATAQFAMNTHCIYDQAGWALDDIYKQYKVHDTGDGEITSADGDTGTNPWSGRACYHISSCASRVVAALDKTYQTGMTKAIDNIKSVLTAVAENTEGATIGIANLRATSATWSVQMDDATAADMALFKSRVGDIDQVHNTKRTHFGTIFNTVANKVFGDGSKPSFIFLLSDFKLNSRKELDALAAEKRRMKRRLGEDAPKLVCYLSRTSRTKNGQTKMPNFFTELCDQQWWSGKDGASDEDLAVSMGEFFCGAN